MRSGLLQMPEKIAPIGMRRPGGLTADHLDIRPDRPLIIDDSAARGKARDSKWNGRKCNPNTECRPIQDGVKRPR
jgi:hypothetical protein